VPIFIDKRGTGEEELYELLNERHLAVERRFIESGDIVFGGVGIERKTVNDLVSSVISKKHHLWDQFKVLKSTYKIPLLIVEGNINYKDRMVSGILASVVLGWRLPYINTHDIHQTTDLIRSLFTKYGVAKTNTYPPKAVIKEASIERIRWAMIQCIVGIGPQMARKILTIAPFTQLANTNPVWLSNQVKYLGPKRAKKLIDVFTQPTLINNVPSSIYRDIKRDRD